MVTDESSQIEILVAEDQRGIHRSRQFHHHFLVDLDIERTNHRTDPPGSEPDEQLLQTFIGEQQNATALADTLALEKSRNVGRRLVEIAECDRCLLVEVDDCGLARVARLVFGKQLGNRLIRNAKLMFSENVRHADLPAVADVNIRSLPGIPSNLAGAS